MQLTGQTSTHDLFLVSMHGEKMTYVIVPLPDLRGSAQGSSLVGGIIARPDQARRSAPDKFQIEPASGAWSTTRGVPAVTLDDRVAEEADVLDLDLDLVAGLEREV